MLRHRLLTSVVYISLTTLAPLSPAFASVSPRHRSHKHMKTTYSDGVSRQGQSLTPADDRYDNVVVWMHGLGDTADGWADASKSLGALLGICFLRLFVSSAYFGNRENQVHPAHSQQAPNKHQHGFINAWLERHFWS